MSYCGWLTHRPQHFILLLYVTFELLDSCLSPHAIVLIASVVVFIFAQIVSTLPGVLAVLKFQEAKQGFLVEI